MRLMRILPAVVLALALTGCGDDEEPKASPDPEPQTDELTSQAEAIVECTDGKGLPGTVEEIAEGFPGIDLTTENETIVVYVLPSSEEAATFENPADLEQEQFDNVLLVGGAITPEHRQVIVDCIEGS
jgi:hypothetical protein